MEATYAERVEYAAKVCKTFVRSGYRAEVWQGRANVRIFIYSEGKRVADVLVEGPGKTLSEVNYNHYAYVTDTLNAATIA